jgi:hypothetical protein
MIYSMDWKEMHHDRRNRPGINELKAYFSDEIFTLFTRFSEVLLKQYNVGCAPGVFTTRHGWTYRFGRNGMYLLSGVTIAEGTFHVDGIAVCDDKSYEKAILLVETGYPDFKMNYESMAAEKIARQSERTKQRVEREKQEVAAMADRIIPEKFNRYHWLPKITRKELIQLYSADMKGLPDEELADEIGFTLYARCVQGRDTWIDIKAGQIKCHHCKSTLYYAKGLIQCDCGYQYLFRDYMRSFRKENMPSGAATHIFNAFITDWERAYDYQQKMRLIDNLIHEFHINLTSGAKGRFVGINLIEGTKKQISDLILTLAYGDNKEGILDSFKVNLRKS